MNYWGGGGGGYEMGGGGGSSEVLPLQKEDRGVLAMLKEGVQNVSTL